MGENIGAAARVMLNFGLTDLRIVKPRDGWPNERALDMAVGAREVVEQAKIYESLNEATANLQFLYATTARTREMDKEVVTPREIALHGATGFVFGPERTGLTNEDITLCDKIISIPVNEKFSSLNLAQTVAIIAYEVSGLKIVAGKRELASKEEIASLFSHLESELDARGFFQEPNKKPGMIANIRTMLARAEFSGQEVRTFRGIIKALTKI